ncbi:ParB/RepB/Spo0J family partition protein [Jannaschia aquimarina]|uniref:ParB-like nuclease domain protein n=1 Tax=Jannaschia aquimarina TaxID=935700 RepID=A0A0D1EC02_9RHOB|nr:ParB N-terminal domain-containing protein [Jannaschia aquimarina]KIT14401.1 ParB-like nuclease domain protein [Jannaschia aquimarina]SNT42161.1 chromosome partitioning protein, ParB family [Jannaschia aquimarina]
MTRKRRMFDINLPEEQDAETDPPIPADLETKSLTPRRRGPMASAIGEAGDALRYRKRIEEEIRAENDALAEEFVRLKREGLIVDLVRLDDVVAGKLVRDRSPITDLELQDLKASILAIGLSNPIRVEPREDGRYELVEGLRRLSAYRELHGETGDERWARIPAGLLVAGQGEAALYRRMVDENLTRKDVSFAEMAALARAYAEAGIEGCEDVDQAVNVLYASVSAQKRSYIRRFAALLMMADKTLAHPYALSRALGLQLVDRLEAEPGSIRDLKSMLDAASKRDATREAEIIREFLAGRSTPLPDKARGAPKGARRGRVALSVPVGPGVKCTATDGKVELRARMDFGTVERARLEAAIEAFFAALEDR